MSGQQRTDDDGDDPRRGGGTVDVALYVTCAPLETGSAVVRFERFTSRDRNKAEVAQRDRLLKGRWQLPAPSPVTTARAEAKPETVKHTI